MKTKRLILPNPHKDSTGQPLDLIRNDYIMNIVKILNVMGFAVAIKGDKMQVVQSCGFKMIIGIKRDNILVHVIGQFGDYMYQSGVSDGQSGMDGMS